MIMTNEFNALKKGFMKQAQDFGLTEKQAFAVFEKHAEGLSEWVARNLGVASGSVNGGPSSHFPIDQQSATGALPFIGGAVGGIGGGLLGAGAGALNGSKDEKGETHRFRNALLGGLAGGTLGGGAGAGLGALAGNAVNPEVYNMVTKMEAAKRNLQDQVAPYKEGVHQATDFFKNLVR
jgi:hypothetical protein